MQLREALTFNDVLLVPKFSTIRSRKLVDTSTQFSRNINLKIPIVSSNMDTITEAPMAIAMATLGGLGIIHRFLTIEEQVAQVAKVKAKGLLVGAAIGVNDYMQRVEALLGAGVDVLVLDVAHGHSLYVIDAISTIKNKWPHAELVAGNVATLQGTLDLIVAGADGVKIGVGPGTICSTRLVTGCGVPQLSAILDSKGSSVPLIADGGIKNSGDVTKALAGGASCVMLGSLLAGTDECPGYITSRMGHKYKVYRGMASLPATISKQQKEGTFTEEGIEDIVPEGVETSVPYKGKVEDVVNQLVGGLRSGMTYCGVTTIPKLAEEAEFIRITSAGWAESLARE